MKIKKIEISDIFLHYDCVANKLYLKGKKENLKKSIIILLLHLFNKITFLCDLFIKV